MKFHFITAVWGSEYTDLYLDVAMPSQLAPGNLPFFVSRHESVYVIYTTPADEARIRKTEVFAKLSGIIPVEFRRIDSGKHKEKHRLLTECHSDTIRQAASACAAIVFLTPDIIISDNTIGSLARHAEEGKKLVLTPGFRVEKETFVPHIIGGWRKRGDAALTVPARELVRAAVAHLHPYSKTIVWNDRSISRYPSHIYWEVPGEGILARCFHIHPVMVVPRADGDLSIRSTIDGDYMNSFDRGSGEVHVVRDSDEVLLCEMSAAAQFSEFKRMKPRAAKVAGWCVKYCNPLHLEFFEKGIRLHAGGITSEWERAERSSEALANEIAALLGDRFFVFKAKVCWGIVDALLAVKSAVFRLLARMGLGKLYRRFSGKSWFDKNANG